MADNRRSAVLLVFIGLYAGHAFAVETRRLTLEELVMNSSAIFVGTIVAADASLDRATNAVWTEYVVAVEETWKGESRAERRLRFFGGEAAGRSEGIAGQPRLEVGVAYLLFVHERKHAFAPTVGVGQGIFRDEGERLVSADGEVLEVAAANVVIRTGALREEHVRRERDPDPRLSTGAPSRRPLARGNEAAVSRPAALHEVRRWLVEPLLKMR